jgi:hypothetical protein
VIQPSENLDLALEAFCSERGGQVGIQDFDGDVAVVSRVSSEKDRSHPALADLAIDPVSLWKSVSKLGQQFRHGAPANKEARRSL